MVNNLPATQKNWIPSLGCEDTLEKGMEPTLVDLPGEFRIPAGSCGKESACNTGDPGSIPWSGRSPGEGNGNPTLSWEIPWTEEAGGLQSMGSQRVGHDSAIHTQTYTHPFLHKSSSPHEGSFLRGCVCSSFVESIHE